MSSLTLAAVSAWRRRRVRTSTSAAAKGTCATRSSCTLRTGPNRTTIQPLTVRAAQTPMLLVCKSLLIFKKMVSKLKKNRGGFYFEGSVLFIITSWFPVASSDIKANKKQIIVSLMLKT